MKIVKIFAKNCNLKPQVLINEENKEFAEKLFIDHIKNIKRNLDINIETFIPEEILDENTCKIAWNLVDKTLDEISFEAKNKFIEFAKENKEICFGDYKISLMEDNEEIKIPNKIGYYDYINIAKEVAESKLEEFKKELSKIKEENSSCLSR